MRTVKLIWTCVVDRDNEFRIETEVIVDDDGEEAAEKAGQEAMTFVKRFMAGIAVAE